MLFHQLPLALQRVGEGDNTRREEKEKLSVVLHVKSYGKVHERKRMEMAWKKEI